MFGAIAGDVIGSCFEFCNTKRTDFLMFQPGSRFTDDTILTVAVADCILNGRDYARTLREYARRYPGAGYGGMFRRWADSDSLEPYNSYGNGSAMRVSPVGWAFDNYDCVLKEAKRSAAATHNHPEGIKGAQAIASAVYWARMGQDKPYVRAQIQARFGYDLSSTLDQIKPGYRFDATCQGSVPQAIIAFLESEDYEDCIRKAISLGGDSDTIACMAGGIAEAYYRFIPDYIVAKVRSMLTPDLLAIIDQFQQRFMRERERKQA
ncbi:MAG: ADP-ribosylglycohydrolase family protein [Syntrophomonas sp.]|nr:ADP-ribosylglycohydrolase family protein [Syntrophomonas sp.]